MKKFTLIISIILVLALCVGGCFLFIRPDTVSESEDNNAVLLVGTMDELSSYIEENNIQTSAFDENTFSVKQEMFGKEADVYFYMNGEAVDNIMVEISLFDYPYANSDNADPEKDNSGEQEIYEFTEKDKKKISEAFESVKKKYEEYIGCNFTTYNKIPTRDIGEIIDTEERFFAGDFVKEYTVRNADGALWIMRYEASYGTSSVTINKVVDETLYEGYIPLVDLSGN